jgi:hypothetical protein
MIH